MTGDNNGRWAGDAAWPLDHALYEECAADSVRMLRNHPSLLLWCARGWAHPPCRHLKTEPCFCVGRAFEVAACPNPPNPQVRRQRAVPTLQVTRARRGGGVATHRVATGWYGAGLGLGFRVAPAAEMGLVLKRPSTQRCNRNATILTIVYGQLHPPRRCLGPPGAVRPHLRPGASRRPVRTPRLPLSPSQCTSPRTPRLPLSPSQCTSPPSFSFAMHPTAPSFSFAMHPTAPSSSFAMHLPSLFLLRNAPHGSLFLLRNAPPLARSHGSRHTHANTARREQHLCTSVDCSRRAWVEQQVRPPAAGGVRRAQPGAAVREQEPRGQAARGVPAGDRQREHPDGGVAKKVLFSRRAATLPGAAAAG
jgi:hypothetical protein